uniref:Ammonium transporter n=1 Tax=Photinus pyralis TaxID=7054 RepID=A0A1Y1KLR8_PHOPY
MIFNLTAEQNETEIPWLYQLNREDMTWVITSSFMIFTMQTGFGMLESGCVSVKNEVNIMMKNVVDIVLGGLTYWIFGFALSFGRSSLNNPFISFGDFCVDPDVEDPMKGAIYTAFLFQMSFATTATTIVSGAMAERCNFKAYCIFSLMNTLVYCVPAGWIWGTQGFLKQLGAVDIAGSGPVHLIGGTSAFASALMLGPRLGRYDNGIAPLPLGSPVNAVMGLFVLWWGWLAFNSGSTYGLSGSKYQYAARAAVMTMISSFGGGTVSLVYSLIRTKGKIEVIDIINGVLGSLVAITAGCFLYEGWAALIIGSVGALIACVSMPLIDMMGVDDPVGATSVHGLGGIWGVIAVGLFAQNPIPLDTTDGRSGLFEGGGWYLLGIQTLSVLCLTVWAFVVTIIMLWMINKIVTIRMELHMELIGADLTEHFVKHGQVGVSRAVSAFKPCIDTTDIDHVPSVGLNPGHDAKVEIIQGMSRKRRPKLSRILRNVTNRENFGINVARKLFPPKKLQRKISIRERSGKGSITSQTGPRITTIEMNHSKAGVEIAWLD